MAGKYLFDQPGAGGSIINKGTIKAADYGLVALIGNNIDNSGVIQARLGNVILASGNKFTLDFLGDQLINFSIDEGTLSDASDNEGYVLKDKVRHSGTILVDGGLVLLSAKSASSVLDHIINMEGIIEAASVAEKKGIIILSGHDSGIVTVSGRLNASGKSSGSTGGTVKITGQLIFLDNATIDVSGDLGGGDIIIGGNAHGAGPEKNALFTYIGKNVNLYADAINQGNGGKVIVWSDKGTWVHGNIYACAGELGGRGGFVETSGAYLNIEGAYVNTHANNGEHGTWLLDPTNIYIATTLESAIAAGMNGADMSVNVFTGSFPQIATASGVVKDSLITIATLTAALNNTLGNLIITTSNPYSIGQGNINVVDSFTIGATSLTLNAANNITINAPIIIGAGDLILNAMGKISFSVSPVFQNQVESLLIVNGNSLNYASFKMSDFLLVTQQELNQINEVVVASTLVYSNVTGPMATNNENALIASTHAIDYPGTLPQAISVMNNIHELSQEVAKARSQAKERPAQVVAQKVVESQCVGDICIDDPIP